MIKSFTVADFKAFRAPQSVELKPITLVFGPNSSGKSSLIHSLLFLNHFLETGEIDVHETRLGGKAVDLGGYKQFVHRTGSDGCAQNLTLEVELPQIEKLGDIEFEKPVAVTACLSFGLEDDLYFVRVGPDNDYLLKNYSVKIDGHQVFAIEVSETVNILDGILGYEIVDIDFKHYVAKQFVYRIATFAGIPKSTVMEFLSGYHFDGPNLPGGFETHTGGPSSGPEATFKASELEMSSFYVIDEFCRDLNKQLRQEIGQLRYLGPLRSFLPREWASSASSNFSGNAFENEAWETILKPDTCLGVNEWLKGHLPTPYELQVNSLIPHHQIVELFIRFRESIKDGTYKGDVGGTESENFIFEIDSLVSKGAMDLVKSVKLRDVRTGLEVSLRDVGIGISQLLPIIIQSFHGRGNLIAIEQPEVHLHPALQADLGDLFIERALGEYGGKNFIIETHSEHLILRILRRIRESTEGGLPEGLPPITSDDVSVLYVQPSTEGSKIIELAVTEDGDFETEWPGGFFEDRLKELF